MTGVQLLAGCLFSQKQAGRRRAWWSGRCLSDVGSMDDISTLLLGSVWQEEVGPGGFAAGLLPVFGVCVLRRCVGLLFVALEGHKAGMGYAVDVFAVRTLHIYQASLAPSSRHGIARINSDRQPYI